MLRLPARVNDVCDRLSSGFGFVCKISPLCCGEPQIDNASPQLFRTLLNAHVVDRLLIKRLFFVAYSASDEPRTCEKATCALIGLLRDPSDYSLHEVISRAKRYAKMGAARSLPLRGSIDLY